ncbi:MAG: divalent-cation tolerance protein CutA [Acidobacteria bacterium]|nr:divalent-cation tolerance protein CutA [Acidobacteriota bacterium]
MSSVFIVFSTVDSRENALKIARQFVAEQLVACVSIIPDVLSVYKWKGVMEEASEVLLMIKTSQDKLGALMNRLPEVHPYEIPEILALPVAQGHPPYLQWLFEQTDASDHQ